MHYRSFDKSQVPTVVQALGQDEMLVLACSMLHVDQSHLFVREDLQVVCYQLAPGRYAYLRFHNGEMELFLPRDHRQHPRRVLC